MVTRETVKESLESRWLMKNILSFCAAYVICILLVVLGGSEFKTNGFWFFMIFISLLFLPIIFYHVYQYMVLFRYLERYEIYEVELKHPQKSTVYKVSIYYTATFQTKKGRTVSKTTKPLWKNERLFGRYLPLEEHSLKAVIAYNDIRDAIVVLESDKR